MTCEPSRRRARLALLLAALGTIAAGPAQADPRAKDLARDRLEQGSQLYRRGQYDAALRKFKEAHALYASPRLFFNLGQTHRKLGQNAEAVEAFERFMAEATDAAPEPRRDAEAALAELRPLVGFLRVLAPADAEVRIDGRAVGNAPLPRAVPLAPGPHQAVVIAPGATGEIVHQVTAVAGRTEVWQAPAPSSAAASVAQAPPSPSLSLSPRPPEPTLAVTAAPVPPAKPLWRRWWPWAAAGAVVAGVAATALLVKREGDPPRGSLGALDLRR